MTTLAGFSTKVNPATEIITAYMAAPYQPTPVPDPSPWVVIGSFPLTAAVRARLSVVGLVAGSAVCRVGLYGPEQLVYVSLTSDVEGEILSDRVDLTPGTYQVAVQFEGAADPGNVAVVRTVQLVP